MQTNFDIDISGRKTQYRGKILIVDDDDSIRLLFFKKLERLGFEIIGANSIKQAKTYIETTHFDSIVLDQFLGDGLGTDIIDDIIATSPFSKIVFLTAHNSVDLATNTLLKGASGFLLKSDPIDNNIRKLIQLLNPTKKEIPFNTVQTTEVIGRSPSITDILNKIEKIKNSDSIIYITGESGVGKEMFAKTIHQLSNRGGENFMTVNCAAISEHLLEAELFGIKKSASSDSQPDRMGHFESCTNGTLILDEVGDLDSTMQAKLLRVLQRKEITPIGSSHPIPVNTRVIAITNRKLSEDVTRGKFREDLYYRLAVINIDIPPLRERVEDIPILVQSFIKKFNKQFGKNVKSPSNEVYAKIKAYKWPGNVRELFNAIERAVLLAEKDLMFLEDLLPARMLDKQSDPMAGQEFILDYREAKNTFEKNYIESLLKHTNYCVTDAAKISNQYRTNIYRLIEKHKVQLKPKNI